MDTKRKPAFTGKAGEYRIASELLLRGHNPSISVVDEGVDIILENGIKIQIKTTNNPLKNDKYQISLRGPNHFNGNKNRTAYSLKSDFTIVWLIKINIFYIIPSAVLVGKKSVDFNTNTNFHKPYINNWDVLNISPAGAYAPASPTA